MGIETTRLDSGAGTRQDDKDLLRHDKDLLRRAADKVLDTPGNQFPKNEAGRRTLVRVLRRWVADIENGTLRPAERASALQLARAILNVEAS